MPKYLFEVSYSVDGAKGLLQQGGTGRQAAIDKALGALGGSIESFHYALGHEDAYLIASLPDADAVAALSITVAAGGGARITTHELLTPDQVDSALKATVDYSPPGSQLVPGGGRRCAAPVHPGSNSSAALAYLEAW